MMERHLSSISSAVGNRKISYHTFTLLAGLLVFFSQLIVLNYSHGDQLRHLQANSGPPISEPCPATKRGSTTGGNPRSVQEEQGVAESEITEEEKSINRKKVDDNPRLASTSGGNSHSVQEEQEVAESEITEEEKSINKKMVDDKPLIATHPGSQLDFKKEKKLRYDSSDASVIAMAQGYTLDTHRRFVGSLRKSGFKGTIMLATEAKMKKGVEKYLLQQNVTILKVNYTECVHKILEDHEVKNKKDKECNTCIEPYQDVKIRWGRFPFLRDALQECEHCTGPVLVTDVRDTIFQRDPFGDGAPEIEGLHLYAEHRTVVASHPFIRKPIQQCKNVTLSGPMICSGTTIGTRETMLGYLSTMYEEMQEWMKDENCWSKKAGGDQAIHNYLYYTGRFDQYSPVQIFDPREEIVNTVGAKGVAISKMHIRTMDGKDRPAHKLPYVTSDPEKGRWLPTEYDLTDDKGYFIDYNGERSRVVHQYDRFGVHAEEWVNRMEGRLWE